MKGKTLSGSSRMPRRTPRLENAPPPRHVTVSPWRPSSRVGLHHLGESSSGLLGIRSTTHRSPIRLSTSGSAAKRSEKAAAAVPSQALESRIRGARRARATVSVSGRGQTHQIVWSEPQNSRTCGMAVASRSISTGCRPSPAIASRRGHHASFQERNDLLPYARRQGLVHDVGEAARPPRGV